MAMMVDGHAIAGTARGERSDWFRNLEASPDVRYWLGGEPREAIALTFAPGQDQPPVEGLPTLVRDVVCRLTPALEAGCRFAVLAPR